MKQFTVPQFIDVEDKIIGPITVRQFIIIIIGGLFVFLEYKLSDFALFLFIGIFTTALFGIFAFAKINGMPFHYFILNIIQTFKKPNLRIWQRESAVALAVKNKKAEPLSDSRPVKKMPVTSSHLSDLSLIIDTGGVYAGETTSTSNFFNNQYEK